MFLVHVRITRNLTYIRSSERTLARKTSAQWDDGFKNRSKIDDFDGGSARLHTHDRLPNPVSSKFTSEKRIIWHLYLCLSSYITGNTPLSSTYKNTRGRPGPILAVYCYNDFIGARKRENLQVILLTPCPAFRPILSLPQTSLSRWPAASYRACSDHGWLS